MAGAPMQLRLKTKITLIMALLVLAVVGVNSTLYVMTLTRQVIRQANDRAQLVSRHVFFRLKTLCRNRPNRAKRRRRAVLKI